MTPVSVEKYVGVNIFQLRQNNKRIVDDEKSKNLRHM